MSTDRYRKEYIKGIKSEESQKHIIEACEDRKKLSAKWAVRRLLNGTDANPR